MNDPLMIPVLDAVERILPGLIESARADHAADFDTLLARLTPARATAIDTLLGRLTADRATAIDTLLGRLSAARAGHIDTTKASVDTLLARLTADRATKLDSLGNSSIIKSLQRGVTEVTATTVSVTVTAVAMAKAVLIVSCIDGIQSTNPPSSAGAGAALTSATAITLTRSDTTYVVQKNPKIAWQLVEFH